ncbi:MAG: hypothetical protein ACLFN4_03075 [Candidatus Acetothermia bacterium]
MMNNQQPKLTITFSAEKRDLFAALQKLADKRGRSVNEVALKAIAEYVKISQMIDRHQGTEEEK